MGYVSFSLTQDLPTQALTHENFFQESGRGRHDVHCGVCVARMWLWLRTFTLWRVCDTHVVVVKNLHR